MVRIFISNVATDFCFFRLFVRTRFKPCRKRETIQSSSLDGCCVQWRIYAWAK